MAQIDENTGKDLRLLAVFIEIYCKNHHQNRDFNGLCAACQRLLLHATVKRQHCPMDPKPACKRCPNHCYHPTYRQQIRQVMRYSGRHQLLRGRLDYLLHWLF